MKMTLHIHHFSLLIFIFFLPILIQAQEKKVSLSVSAGYVRNAEPDPFMEVNGFHIGANLFKTKARWIGWDTQLSMNYTYEYESAFNFNGLIGGRIYFNGPENKNRYFFNALGGLNFASAVGGDYVENLSAFGYSGGFHAALGHIQIGISFERPEVLVFKVGYNF